MEDFTAVALPTGDRFAAAVSETPSTPAASPGSAFDAGRGQPNLPRIGQRVAPMLELRSVSYAYGAHRALDGVSLSLEPGRLVGVLGPNGSGKSTLVRIAAGLVRPSSGTVRLEGSELTALRRGDLARRIAVVPQGAPLPEAFTGLEIVLMGRTPHMGWLGTEGPRDTAVAWKALELTGATSLAGRRAGELSGGERQRLVLARALAQEPDILLLDEPTTHLDITHQLATLNLVVSMARTEGLAALAVVHDLHLAAEYADDLLVLRDGKTVARGAPETVLTAELIASVYGVTVTVLPHPSSGRPAIFLPAAYPPSAQRDGVDRHG